MALFSIIDKSGFQAGLYTGNFTLVDIGFFTLTGSTLDVQIVKVLSVDHGDAQFFLLGRIDKHSFHDKCLGMTPGIQFRFSGFALACHAGMQLSGLRTPRESVE